MLLKIFERERERDGKTVWLSEHTAVTTNGIIWYNKKQNQMEKQTSK